MYLYKSLVLMCQDVITVFSYLLGSVSHLTRRRRIHPRPQNHSIYAADSWIQKAMEANYDEDLTENPFFQEFQQTCGSTFEKVIREEWILCVPRCGSFVKGSLVEEDFLNHILIPSDELPGTHFRTLTGRDVKLSNRVLSIEYDIAKPCSAHLLFEETFYTDDTRKYRIWCIEQPLEQGTDDARDKVITVSNFRESIDLLWTEVSDKSIFKSLEFAVDQFRETHSADLETQPLTVQRDLVGSLYAKSLSILLKDVRLRERTGCSRHFLQTIKVAVETYVLHGLQKILPKSVSTSTASEDSQLNKIIKNLHELQLRDLGVRLDLYDGVSRGKLELSRLDGFTTVLGKINCLKRAVRFISQGDTSVSSDDLLPVLVFLVIKSGLPNWSAQLTFMKHFRFSSNSTYDADEAGFLITSLEAAVEHVKSGVLIGSIYPESDSIFEVDLEEEQLEKEKEVTLSDLFENVRKDNLSEVRRILSKERRQEEGQKQLCHPLCSCSSCEKVLKGDFKSSWPTVHSRDDRGLTALHVACLYGKVTIVDHLLQHHAEVNDFDADGVTPLHCAASRGHQTVLLLLLHNEADPTVVDSRGNTALHLASDHGHEECIKALVYFAEQNRTFLDVNCRNSNGDTGLHFASKWGYEGIVEFLLVSGANPRICNRRGQTPLALAHSSRVSRLLENALRIWSEVPPEEDVRSSLCERRRRRRRRRSSDERTTTPTTPESESVVYSSEKLHKVERLLSAITEGDIRLACYYLGLEGPQLKSSQETYDLCHPLCRCQRCASIEESFNDYRQKPVLGVNCCNGDGESPLHVAATTGCTDMVQLLLDAGARVNVTTKSEGRTPLHLACLRERLQVVKLLLNCSTCDVNIQDNDGNTALHLVCRAGNVSLVELLVRYDAKKYIRNAKGATPLDEVEKKMSNDIFSSLAWSSIADHLRGLPVKRNTSQRQSPSQFPGV